MNGPIAQTHQCAPASPSGLPAIYWSKSSSRQQSGSLSCVALVEGYLARIKAYDQAGPKLNAIQNVNPTAVAMAGEFDAKLKSGGPLGRLHCIPVLVKDQIETNFMPTTYGSALFKTFVPSRNATIVEKMLAEGAIILAKTNLGEFAAGGAGSAFGDCHNAYDPARHASGSSCGSGIAVTANFGAVGIGEDTAGSIRGPASHSNLVALNPTLQLVSRFGAMPQGPSRDPIAACPETARKAVIAHHVSGDPNSDDAEHNFRCRVFTEPYSAARRHNAACGQRSCHLANQLHHKMIDMTVSRGQLLARVSTTAIAGLLGSAARKPNWVGSCYLDELLASQWVWTVSYGYHEGRTPTHGYAGSREAVGTENEADASQAYPCCFPRKPPSAAMRS